MKRLAVVAAALVVAGAASVYAQTFYPELPALTGNEKIQLAFPNTLGPFYTDPNQIAAYVGATGTPVPGVAGSIQTSNGSLQFGTPIVPGTGVSTALAIAVGSAGAFVKNNGDALSGTFTGAPTISGAWTFSAVPLFTGLSAGTQVSCMGLDSGNHLVLALAACGSGGSGITQLTGDVTAGPGSGPQVATIANLAVTNAKMAVGAAAANLGTTAVTPGSYTYGSFTVGADGRLTFAANGAAPAAGANPTATAGPTAINGSATTFMRSDGAPAIQLGTASVPGIVRVDGTTITVSGGIITAPGAGAVSITAATPNLVFTPSPITGTGTIGSTITYNTQAGNSAYTALAGDNTKLIKRTNTVTQTDVFPQATGSFGSGWSAEYVATIIGNTITPTTSTIGGLASLKTGIGQYIGVSSDGNNYLAVLGVPPPPAQTGATYLTDQMTWGTPAGAGNMVGSGATTAGNVLTSNNTGGTLATAVDSTKAAPAGAFVGDTDAQNLSNKGFDCTTNTCTNFPRSETIGWSTLFDPGNTVIYTVESGSTAVVKSIRGTVNDASGTAGTTVQVNKAPSGTACSAGTNQATGTFDANGTANTNQTLTLAGGGANNLAAGDRLCLVTAGVWTTSLSKAGLSIKVLVQ